MPPKVDPTEVRFSNFAYIQLTSRFSEVRQDQLLHLPPNWVPLVSYNLIHLERQEGW